MLGLRVFSRPNHKINHQSLCGIRAILVRVATEGGLRFACSQKRLPFSLVNKMEMIIASKTHPAQQHFTYRHRNGARGQFQLPQHHNNLFFSHLVPVQMRAHAYQLVLLNGSRGELHRCWLLLMCVYVYQTDNAVLTSLVSTIFVTSFLADFLENTLNGGEPGHSSTCR